MKNVLSSSVAAPPRRGLIIILVAAVVGLGLGPLPRSKPVRVEIVMAGRTTRIQPQVIGLRDGLEELKYVEGGNLVSNLLQEETPERLRSNLAAKIHGRSVDVVVTLGTVETAIAKEITQKVPIVFLPAADPVQSGFVQSLTSPGTNLTGLTFFAGVESIAKQLEIFKEVVPPLRKVFAVFDERAGPWANGQRLGRVRAVGRRLGIEFNELPVKSPAEATQRLAAFPRELRKAGIFVVCSGMFRELEALAAMAIKHGLPLFGCNAFQVAEQRVFLSYAPDLYSIGYRGAWYVDRILKGAKPENLPVETPPRFEMVLNRKTAAEIGLTIPPKMLLLADRVFD